MAKHAPHLHLHYFLYHHLLILPFPPYCSNPPPFLLLFLFLLLLLQLVSMIYRRRRAVHTHSTYNSPSTSPPAQPPDSHIQAWPFIFIILRRSEEEGECEE